ncbi:MAG: hypothetical protein SO128_01960 [Clostridium cadaveris]|uniref:hypothetical protein n=1 Tax=Clostridium cadaveris TaxID=1529 RepID=UPI002A8E6822|nr:hypothetical protein [Clostridium cadaveris]
MLKLTAIEIVARLIPEALIFIFATYALSKTKIDIKRYITASCLLTTCIFIIRMLPISYGVHTILNIIVQAVIIIYINRIEIIDAIKCTITTAISLFILEGLNMLLLTFIFDDQVESIMRDPFLKTLSGLPSLAAFAIIIITYYFYLKKKDRLKND